MFLIELHNVWINIFDFDIVKILFGRKKVGTLCVSEESALWC